MRWLGRLILGLLALGVLALLAVMFWLPPNDPDAFALAQQREARHAAFRLGKPMPGAPGMTETLEAKLSRTAFKLGDPIFIRIYKLEFELEVWMKRDSGYSLFATYPICYFSGQLGPKLRRGDRQSPEGFYRVEARQLNPMSRWHRAFNLGFPNAYDQSYGRTGTYLMVHGGCSSVGCYAMTNSGVDDLFRLAKAAFAAGQPSFQVQALPFRMTAEAMASRASHTQAAFWSELKSVADTFEATREPPEVVVCDGHYRATPRNSVQSGGLQPGCRKI